MASLNINTSDDPAIRKYARELGIGNWHNMRMDNLREKIAEVEAGKAAEELSPASELTPAPELSEAVLTQPNETLVRAEPVVVKAESEKKVKSLDDMTDAEVIAAAEAEKARQFLREAQAKREQNIADEGAKVNMEHKINVEAPRVKVMIPFQEGKPLVRPVIVNGVRWDIPVEVETWVPQPIAEALDNCMRDEYANYRKFKQGERDFLSKKTVIKL